MVRDRAERGPEVVDGLVGPELADEFPGLCLRCATVAARRRSSPRSLVRRLAELSSRYRGATVVAMRTKPIPHAYRSFFRQIGLDPDVDRIPSERVAVARLAQGGFRSVDLIADACLIALVETGVPVWALDARAVAGERLQIRPGDGLGSLRRAPRSGDAGDLQQAVRARCTVRRTVARPRSGARDAAGRPLHGRGAGVPAIHLEEALWTCIELLS